MVEKNGSTSRSIRQLLPQLLEKITQAQKTRPDLVLAAWPEVIGAKLAPMTEAVSFIEGTLLVKVKNAALYSLLVQYEKTRLLNHLKQKFPNVKVQNIIFRMG